MTEPDGSLTLTVQLEVTVRVADGWTLRSAPPGKRTPTLVAGTGEIVDVTEHDVVDSIRVALMGPLGTGDPWNVVEVTG